MKKERGEVVACGLSCEVSLFSSFFYSTVAFVGVVAVVSWCF